MVLLGVTGFPWVLPSFTRFCSVFTELNKVFLGFRPFDRVFRVLFSRVYRVLPGSTGYQLFPGVDWVLPSFPVFFTESFGSFLGNYRAKSH